MVFDLKLLKDNGFNMVRKHIKVETDLFYKACDTMGLLVMQDMPALPANNIQSKPNPARTLVTCVSATADRIVEQAEFERQLFDLIETHKSFPSIYTWVIYNERWGQLPSAPEIYLTPQVRSIDPTRLINSVTGWDDHGAGDYLDNHHYSSPQCGTPFQSSPSSAYDPARIGFQGEFGGIGHNVSIENLWNNQEAINTINQTYELDNDIPTWNYRAHLILSELRDQTDRFACSGGVWTQTTDVEGEVNGLVTYDRRIQRTYVDQWRADINALYAAAAARANGAPGGLGGSSSAGVASSTATAARSSAAKSVVSGVRTAAGPAAATTSSGTHAGTKAMSIASSVAATASSGSQASARSFDDRSLGWKGMGAAMMGM